MSTETYKQTKRFSHFHIVQLYIRGDGYMEREDFIKRLVELRMNKGVSARDMSLSIGQSAGYINNIENGHNLPSMAMFFEICEYLHTKPSEFFSYEEDQEAHVSTEFLEQFNKLGKEDKALLLKIAGILFEQRGKENG